MMVLLFHPFTSYLWAEQLKKQIRILRFLCYKNAVWLCHYTSP